MKITQLFIFAALSVALLAGIMPGEDASAVEPVDFGFKSNHDYDSTKLMPQVMEHDDEEDDDHSDEEDDDHSDEEDDDHSDEEDDDHSDEEDDDTNTVTQSVSDDQSAEIQRLEQENNDLKQQIEDLKQQIENLNQVLMEQIKVIMNTLKSLKGG
jgi:hypothetical protein